MKRVSCAIVCALLFTSAGVLADEVSGYRGWGPRVGVTVDPDQIHFGAHADLGQITPRLRFQPNVEVGVGDNITIIALNFEAAYRFRGKWDVWSPYAGGGIGVNFISHERGGDNTDAGLNGLFGIEKGTRRGDRFFIEMKLGLLDPPDLKATVGWTFFQ